VRDSCWWATGRASDHKNFASIVLYGRQCKETKHVRNDTAGWRPRLSSFMRRWSAPFDKLDFVSATATLPACNVNTPLLNCDDDDDDDDDDDNNDTGDDGGCQAVLSSCQAAEASNYNSDNDDDDDDEDEVFDSGWPAASAES